MTVFTLGPLLLSLVAAMFDINATITTWDFVGADNVQDVLTDERVHRAAVNTAVLSLLVIPTSVVLGLSFALIAHYATRMRTVVRTALFLPVTANLIAMAIVFRWIYAFPTGFLNQSITAVGLQPINFLQEGAWVLPSIALLEVWRGASFNMILFLAGLGTIPATLFEAAASDGIRGVQRLRLIILPQLRPVLLVAVVITIITSFQAFESISILTSGGPAGASETLLYLAWRFGFEAFRLGSASAIVFLVLVILVAIGLLRFLNLRGRLGETHA